MANKLMQTRPTAAMAANPPRTPPKTIAKMDGLEASDFDFLFAI